jgi:hypothetical protein
MRGVRALFVVDFLVVPGEEPAGRALLRAIEDCARRDGIEILSALLPGEGAGRRALRSAGYLRVPEPLHPQTIRLSARGFGRFAGFAELIEPSAWLLSWADTDVV